MTDIVFLISVYPFANNSITVWHVSVTIKERKSEGGVLIYN